MADITITINNPVLVAGQKFKVRYRLLPLGVFGAYQDETNAPFTLTGLSAGKYEIEYITVLVGDVECPTITDTFEIVEFECLDFTVTQEASPYRIKVEFTVPGGYAQPACGWNIGYRDVSGGVGTGGFANANFTTLTTSPVYINVPAPLRDLNVRITANNCDGEATICYDEIVAKPVIPPCVSMPFVELVSIEFKRDRPNKVEEYYLTYKFRATVPNCEEATLNISQTPTPPGSSGILPWATSQIISVGNISGDQVRGLFIYYNGYSGAPFPRTWTFDLLDCCDIIINRLN